ncbi:MAG: DUF1015 domain-containing protein [Candidatus Omnitrophica bacterium]|nr:DUF1015 domain-containing protein [Candidatus Omnitrophota bacterium]
MPKIAPFRGIVYNAGRIKKLESVIAPPYDIISEKMQDELCRLSPYNIVRLELNKIEPSDDVNENRYTRAKKFFESWLEKGILVRDKKPTFYVYSQRYKDGAKHVDRIGFLALMEIDAKGSGKVLPHENTLLAPKIDRLNLIRQVRANLSPIFVLYDDSSHRVLSLLKKITAKKPFIDVMFEGVRNRAWRMDDERDIKKLERLMNGKRTFIADGHHRFEVSRMYSAESQDTGSKYVMAYFVEANERMLTVLPAHRLIVDVGGLKVEEILERLGKFFRVAKKPTLQAMIKDMERLKSHHAFGMYAPANGFYLLVLKDARAVDEVIKDKPRQWKRLDVSILHLFIFQHLLGIRDDDDNVEFVKSPKETVSLVDSGKFALAFFLNPTEVSQVKSIARLGEKMPRKATYFYPKPVSGIVINKH